MAVNVTLVPEQMVVALAVMETVGTKIGFTTRVMLLLVAVVLLKQLALLVSSQLTISPLFNTAELNVGLLVPAFAPFTFHW